jgi:hypothetical protein
MIDNFVIKGSNKTPMVNFDGGTGVLEISGKSIPENSLGFYQPLFSWLDSYGQEPVAKTEVKIILEYFNTSSSKCLLDIFRKVESIKKAGKSDVVVLWHYEAGDEDMQEAGEDYQSLTGLPFTFIEI